MHFFEYRK